MPETVDPVTVIEAGTSPEQIVVSVAVGVPPVTPFSIIVKAPSRYNLQELLQLLLLIPVVYCANCAGEGRLMAAHAKVPSM